MVGMKIKPQPAARPNHVSLSRAKPRVLVLVPVPAPVPVQHHKLQKTHGLADARTWTPYRALA